MQCNTVGRFFFILLSLLLFARASRTSTPNRGKSLRNVAKKFPTLTSFGNNIKGYRKLYSCMYCMECCIDVGVKRDVFRDLTKRETV